MDVLKEKNSDYIAIIIQVISIVLIIFVFFLSGMRQMFLSQRKRNWNFTFMGLDNVKIGKMYVIEVAMIGLLSLIIGLGSGALFSKLLQCCYYAYQI
ncbi:MAG: FtsX-like permease family protein [Thomasclavelia ramosa]